MHAVYCNAYTTACCLYTPCMSCMYGNATCLYTTVCMHEVILFFLQTMKIVLTVVALVAYFAAVNCQDALCLASGTSGNLVSCATMFAVSLPTLNPH